MAAIRTKYDEYYISGFSLIELMIVIAIIGILAAIAVPAYGDYIIRSRTSELLTSTATLKAAISEYRAVSGVFPSNFDQAGVSDPALASDMIDNVKISNKGGTPVGSANVAIKITGDSAKINAAETIEIYLEGTWGANGIKWNCGTGVDSTSYKYVPANCRDIPPSGYTW